MFIIYNRTKRLEIPDKRLKRSENFILSAPINILVGHGKLPNTKINFGWLLRTFNPSSSEFST